MEIQYLYRIFSTTVNIKHYLKSHFHYVFIKFIQIKLRKIEGLSILIGFHWIKYSIGGPFSNVYAQQVKDPHNVLHIIAFKANEGTIIKYMLCSH